MTRLETLHLIIKAPTTDAPFHLQSQIAKDAHCTTKELWCFYHEGPQGTSLCSFKLELWRWVARAAHPDELGLRRKAHVDKFVFTSWRQQQKLIVQARHQAKLMTTTYEPSPTESIHDSPGDPNMFYVPAYPCESSSVETSRLFQSMSKGSKATKRRIWPWFGRRRE